MAKGKVDQNQERGISIMVVEDVTTVANNVISRRIARRG